MSTTQPRQFGASGRTIGDGMPNACFLPPRLRTSLSTTDPLLSNVAKDIAAPS